MSRAGPVHRVQTLAGLFAAGVSLVSAQGAPVIDDSFLLLFNAGADPVVFTLPAVVYGRRWTTELSTAEPEVEAGSAVFPARGVVPVESRSLVLLRRVG